MVVKYSGVVSASSNVTMTSTMTFNADKTFSQDDYLSQEGKRLCYGKARGTYTGDPTRDGIVIMTVEEAYQSSIPENETTNPNSWDRYTAMERLNLSPSEKTQSLIVDGVKIAPQGETRRYMYREY